MVDSRDSHSSDVDTLPAFARFQMRRAPIYEFFKRAFDLAAGIGILLLLLPMMPVIAAMIRLDSPGPIFFRQDRVGRDGRVFKFYKFRSMYVGSETRKAEVQALNEQSGPIFKSRRDPRITSVGAFLRRSSLDEIPQILNVLKGDMSLVGPRPQMPDEVAQYENWQRLRMKVKPGITCLWQISGRSHISFDEWMRLDIEYIKTRGFKTDVTVLLKTLPAVMARKGAY